jgi:excisionase family DNA binding protein
MRGLTPLLTPEEAAERVGVSRAAIMRLGLVGIMGAVRLGPRLIRFRPDLIEGIIAEGRPALLRLLDKVAEPPRGLRGRILPFRTSVYFIRGGRCIKIGYTAGVAEGRLATLQIGSPTTLRLLGTIPAPEAFERALHRFFKPEREQGEWFRASAFLMEHVTAAIGYRQP